MAHVRPVARASVAVLTVSVCVTFVLTVLFTYTTCVLQSQCPPLPQLPTTVTALRSNLRSECHQVSVCG